MIIRHKILYLHIHIHIKINMLQNSLISRSKKCYRIPNLAAAQKDDCHCEEAESESSAQLMSNTSDSASRELHEWRQ